MEREAVPLFFMGTSYRDLVVFPEEVQHEVGFALFRAQQGARHVAAKPLKGFGGASVLEIAVNDRSGTYRTVYSVKFQHAVYVLHAFQKKSTRGIKRPRREIELVQARLDLAAEHYEEHKYELEPKEER
jgi:phage-related protein